VTTLPSTPAGIIAWAEHQARLDATAGLGPYVQDTREAANLLAWESGVQAITTDEREAKRAWTEAVALAAARAYRAAYLLNV
jgi:hypothetical protein